MIIIETVTVPKIGDGTDDNPFKPDTTALYWRVISETESSFTIEVLEL